MDKDFLKGFLNSATALATPFVQQFAFGGDRLNERGMAEDRDQWNQLNGSGANDRYGNRQLPREGEFFYNNPVANSPVAAPNTSMIMIAVVALFAILLIKK